MAARTGTARRRIIRAGRDQTGDEARMAGRLPLQSLELVRLVRVALVAVERVERAPDRDRLHEACVLAAGTMARLAADARTRLQLVRHRIVVTGLEHRRERPSFLHHHIIEAVARSIRIE